MAEEAQPSTSRTAPRHGWRFWAIFPGLCVTSILCALDSTILSTVLPTITSDLHSSSEYVWIINAYTLTFTAIQPLYGQVADIFGRKAAIVVAISLFLLGSGICGGAQSTDMLIGGRAIQGLGGGGLSILPAMVVCDLVPLRERQKYTGLVYGAFAIGTFIGPVVGGVMVDHIPWRFIFWLNLPPAGLALGLVVAFLKVSHNRSGSVWKQLARIDYFGNLFLMGAVTSILLALAGAGVSRPWSSWHTLVPLLLGLVALPLFVLFEASSLCLLPTVPLRLFSNRTSALAFLLTFLHGVMLYWGSYFLPSGINTLPAALSSVPFGIAGGFMIAKTGRYRLNQIVGFALAAIGIECCSVLNQNSLAGVWATLEIISAAGAGSILTATLPAMQALLAEADVASSTATWGFIQSLGFVWGVAIPSSIFETKFRTFIVSLHGQVQREVIDVFVASLKLVWEMGSAFAILGFLISLGVKDMELRETLETSYGYYGELSRKDNLASSKE
ncbi:major facilitator superfamily protein [Mollisia scopiformis]|uniref:Major facilitator superfamily protein n=1 Tax=Mollisia scopiformis TaxID=149040 RepID=A0A194WY85_MOLSC|nr:major facilitator superfamily protein [Mollisia scopiformis]KUJ12567.1 major facilitator superfamily protein [Mollisia scopiformis]